MPIAFTPGGSSLAFDATNPAPIGTAAPGTAATVPHRDHVHAGDHVALASIGTKTHAQIDTHVAGDPFAQHGQSPSCRVRHSANQSIPNATYTISLMDTETFDTDAMHFTSAAALTGTVTKTATSAALVGAGTLFTTELSVGQVITVPGTATEKRVVTAIADNTHLTVDLAYVNTAGGQTASRVNSPIVFRTAGLYMLVGEVRFAFNATGERQAHIVQKNRTSANDGTNLGNTKQQAVTSGGETTNFQIVMFFVAAQWDYVELIVYQDSTVALNLDGSNPNPGLSAVRIGA